MSGEQTGELIVPSVENTKPIQKAKIVNTVRVGSFPRVDNSDPKPLSYNEENYKGEEVRDEWFRAYIKANGLIPQDNLGVDILMLDSVLQSPPQSWEKFSHTLLSGQQVDELGHLVTNMHRARGIPYVRGTEVKKGEMGISDSTIQDLWRDFALPNTIEGMYDFVSEQTATSVEKDEEKGAFIQNFMDDPKNKPALDSFKRGMNILAQGLDDPAIKELAKLRKILLQERGQLRKILEGGDSEAIKVAMEDREVIADKDSEIMKQISEMLYRKIVDTEPEFANSYLIKSKFGLTSPDEDLEKVAA